MQVAADSIKKVRKDCYKFIKSHETSTEKFGNKNGMIKSFLFPMSHLEEI